MVLTKFWKINLFESWIIQNVLKSTVREITFENEKAKILCIWEYNHVPMQECFWWEKIMWDKSTMVDFKFVVLHYVGEGLQFGPLSLEPYTFLTPEC
jgi:hypothetical protein